MGRVVVNILIILFIIVPPVSAGQLPKPIDRVAHDRLYFTTGSESLVYSDCPFVIIKKNDTLYSGLIEESILGASYSYPTNHYFDTLNVEKLRAVLTTADIDSLASLTIHATVPEYIEILELIYGSKFSSIRQENNNFLTQNGNPIHITSTDRQYQYPGNQIIHKTDLSLSYRLPEDNNHKLLPAPYIAILLPNPNHSINDKNYLSSSLYYRYDPSKLPFMFESENCREINCLAPLDSGCTRDYAYDVERGRTLLRFLQNSPKEITLAVSHVSLLPAARYFADVLSRDRIQVHIIDELHLADFTIRYIPYLIDDPSVGLEYLTNLLNDIPSQSGQRQEDLRQLNNHLHAVKEVVSDNFRNYYYNLIDYSLKYNFGVFPLFQPTITVTYQPNIKVEQAINNNGIINFSEIIKIRFPSEYSGEKR